MLYSAIIQGYISDKQIRDQMIEQEACTGIGKSQMIETRRKAEIIMVAPTVALVVFAATLARATVLLLSKLLSNRPL